MMSQGSNRIKVPDKKAILSKYAEVEARFLIWADQVAAVVSHDDVMANLVRPVAISNRTKEHDKLYEKVLRKHDMEHRPISDQNFTQELTDLAGVRVILPSKTRIEVACQRMRELEDAGYWKIDHVVLTIWHPAERKLIEVLEGQQPAVPDARYVGRHFIVEPTSMQDDSIRIACEVQIRTLLEEGVLSVCHRIAYKQNVPEHITDRLKTAVELIEVIDESIRIIEESAITP